MSEINQLDYEDHKEMCDNIVNDLKGRLTELVDNDIEFDEYLENADRNMNSLSMSMVGKTRSSESDALFEKYLGEMKQVLKVKDIRIGDLHKMDKDLKRYIEKLDRDIGTFGSELEFDDNGITRKLQKNEESKEAVQKHHFYKKVKKCIRQDKLNGGAVSDDSEEDESDSTLTDSSVDEEQKQSPPLFNAPRKVPLQSIVNAEPPNSTIIPVNGQYEQQQQSSTNGQELPKLNRKSLHVPNSSNNGSYRNYQNFDPEKYSTLSLTPEERRRRKRRMLLAAVRGSFTKGSGRKVRPSVSTLFRNEMEEMKKHARKQGLTTKKELVDGAPSGNKTVKQRPSSSVPQPAPLKPIKEEPEVYYNDDNTPYCVCHQPSYGAMIACDSNDCEIEWFHYECVGIRSPPQGKWYCLGCRTASGKVTPRTN